MTEHFEEDKPYTEPAGMPAQRMTPAQQDAFEQGVEDGRRDHALRMLEHDAFMYHLYKKDEEDNKAKAAEIKPRIIATLSKYGVVPDTAPKSQRVETKDFICTLTTGTSTEIDDEAVHQLSIILGKSKKLRALFALMFRPRVEYTMLATARETMLHSKWPKAIKEQVQIAYLRCFGAKTTTPSLSIDSKAEIAAKQRAAAEEAEAKAQGAASKRRGKVAA